MWVLPSLPQEVVQLFLGVSQMCLGSSPALVSSLKSVPLLAIAGDLNSKDVTTLLGMTRLCSVTVFCTEMGRTPLDAAGGHLSAASSEAALLVHNSHRDPCLQCAIRFYSQPLGLLRATPPVPFSVLFFLTSALGAAASNHPPSAGRERKFRKK